jgi:hypothetical protein
MVGPYGGSEHRNFEMGLGELVQEGVSLVLADPRADHLRQFQ